MARLPQIGITQTGIPDPKGCPKEDYRVARNSTEGCPCPMSVSGRGCPKKGQHKIKKEEEIKLFLQEPEGFRESLRSEKLEPSVCDLRSEEIFAFRLFGRTLRVREERKAQLTLTRFTQTQPDLTGKLSQLHSGFKRQTRKLGRRHTILNDRQVSRPDRLANWHW